MQRQLALVAGILQVEVHGVAGQGRVGHRPRARLLAQHQVRPRPGAQVGKPSVDSVCIGLQRAHSGPGESIQVGFHARADPVHAVALVGLQRARAQQLGQFPGGAATHQVHLEEALLRVYVAQCARHVGFVGGIDGDDAERVALHLHRLRQSRQDQVALQRRHAAAQQPPARCQREDSEYQQQQRDALEPP